MESADIIFQESKQASWHHRLIVISTAPFRASWALQEDMTLRCGACCPSVWLNGDV